MCRACGMYGYAMDRSLYQEESIVIIPDSITVIQEGHLNKNVLNFTSTPYKQHLPDAMFGMFDFDVEVNRMFKFTENRLIQVVIDKERYFYQKVYERIE
uniref:Uncharacterized protein n=1 Tax=Romanomermis culicivorax TaxID=13658 RepID=A0A915ISG7_ROMCU